MTRSTADTRLSEGEAATLAEAEAATARLLRLLVPQESRGNTAASNINVNASGIGVAIAMACCLAMLTGGVLGALWASREFQRYDTEIALLKSRDNAQQAYLNAIFRVAPELKKEIDEEK